ncbi:PucR family transcriptional regulator [Allokutzneria multivorans]|uniref:PucR family transcriptional regulator n=1 Tax=Allokutzneria multivorans TaxID=1142134 RepID=A0ABP7QQ46_9PSEU
MVLKTGEPTGAAGEMPTVALGDLVGRADLGLSVLVGPIEGRRVRWVHVSELRDPGRYLVGNELLFTAGVDFPSTAQEIDVYVRRLAEAGAAALGFGVTPVHDTVPPLLISACERHGLPLLLVSIDVTFLRIGQEVSLMLAEVEREGVRKLSTAQAALTTAAASEGPTAVVRRLARLLKGWAVLFDPLGRRVASGGDAPSDDELRLADRVRAPKGPLAATAHHGSRQLVAHALRGAGSGPRSVLVAGDSFQAADRAVLSVGVALLSLLIASNRSSPELTAGLLGLAVDGVDSASLLEKVLDAPTGTQWRVVRARRLHKSATAFDTPLLAPADAGGILVVLPEDRPFEPKGWLVGASGPVPLGELRSAAVRAERLLAEAVVECRSRIDDSTVDSLVSSVDARSFAVRSLSPVVEAGLRDTLHAWLAHHGGWDAAADALGVHRNTVRHRVTRIGELLGRDLADPDTRAELWLALRWLPD